MLCILGQEKEARDYSVIAVDGTVSMSSIDYEHPQTKESHFSQKRCAVGVMSLLYLYTSKHFIDVLSKVRDEVTETITA